MLCWTWFVILRVSCMMAIRLMDGGEVAFRLMDGQDAIAGSFLQ